MKKHQNIKNDIELKCNVSVPTLTKVYEHLTEYTHKINIIWDNLKYINNFVNNS